MFFFWFDRNFSLEEEDKRCSYQVILRIRYQLDLPLMMSNFCTVTPFPCYVFGRSHQTLCRELCSTSSRGQCPYKFFFKSLMYRYLSLLSTHLFAQSFILMWTCISLLCLNSAWQLKKIEIHFLTILTARSLRSVGLFPNETSLLGFQMAAFSLHAHGERSEGERFLLSPALKRALVLLE